MGAFLPVLLQSVALQNAGFPTICPNYVENDTELGNRIFNNYDNIGNVSRFFRDNRCPIEGTPCDWTDDRCLSLNSTHTYCIGEPVTASTQCLELDGYTKYPLFVVFLGSNLDPTEFTTLFISFSVHVLSPLSLSEYDKILGSPSPL